MPFINLSDHQLRHNTPVQFKSLWKRWETLNITPCFRGRSHTSKISSECINELMPFLMLIADVTSSILQASPEQFSTCRVYTAEALWFGDKVTSKSDSSSV